jgi:DNA-binding MarR family transcriptional regulator
MLRTDRTTMVNTVDALERDGYVVRRRNPQDRREQLLELTPAGERVRRRADEIVLAAEREFLAPLSAKERTELKRMLATLAERGGRVPG